MVAVNLNVVDRGRLAKSTMRRLRTVTTKYKVQNRNQAIAGKLSAGSECPKLHSRQRQQGAIFAYVGFSDSAQRTQIWASPLDVREPCQLSG
ncbi:hypothetical protein LB504_011318 [Fusarium proliferatum]|nr:hypothetical protein LB504_011318 [Fusarium proliferatum]